METLKSEHVKAFAQKKKHVKAKIPQPDMAQPAQFHGPFTHVFRKLSTRPDPQNPVMTCTSSRIQAEGDFF